MRRTTYKISRMMDLGNGAEAHPILETNDKVTFFETLDELMSNKEGFDFIKHTARTAVVSYIR